MRAILECSEDVHLLIKKKQIELKEKYGRKVEMQEITNVAISAGIDAIDDEYSSR